MEVKKIEVPFDSDEAIAVTAELVVRNDGWGLLHAPKIEFYKRKGDREYRVRVVQPIFSGSSEDSFCEPNVEVFPRTNRAQFPVLVYPEGGTNCPELHPCIAQLALAALGEAFLENAIPGIHESEKEYVAREIL